MIPERAWSLAFEAPNDPGAGGWIVSCAGGAAGAGSELRFLTTMGAGAFVSASVTGFLTTVSGAMIEVDFFAAGGWVSLVDKHDVRALLDGE